MKKCVFIESKNNKVLKKIYKLLKSKSFRKEQSEFVVEGARLCYDAFLSGLKIKTLIYSEKAAEKYKNIVSDLKKNADEVYILSENLFSCISDTQSPQGILCICPFVDKNSFLDKINFKNKMIALESIQDPSNLGTIFRTAEAFGINNIILSNCCDIYNPKVLRGSMGAIFRLKFFISSDLKSDIIRFNEFGFATYATVPDYDAKSVNSVSFREKSVIIIGNEGNGIKKDTLEVCSEKITIPMLGKAESLNVAMAAGIFMWELVRGG